MKSFYEWLKLLNEMPLSHYGHEFIDRNDEKDEPPETFFSKQDKFQIYTRTPEQWKFKDAKSLDLLVNDKFSKKDKTLISHPKTAKILEKKLKSSKYNFNILFIEEERSRLHDVKFKTKQELIKSLETKPIEEKIKDYVETNNLNINQSITYAANVSTGHLMTPWIILHKMAHAISGAQPGATPGSHQHSWIPYSKFAEILSKTIGKKLDFGPTNNKDFFMPLKNMFAFQSMQQTGDFSIFGIHNRASLQELFHESITEYLWHGKIRLSPDAPEDKKELYKKCIFEIESLIVECLDNCVGKILSDINIIVK
jgi:hypothetical protein